MKIIEEYVKDRIIKYNSNDFEIILSKRVHVIRGIKFSLVNVFITLSILNKKEESLVVIRNEMPISAIQI